MPNEPSNGCTCGPSAKAEDHIPLSQFRPGQTGTVCTADLPASDRRLLRAMGLRDEARLMMCRHGEPCIVRVMGGCSCTSRIGLSRPLAERVLMRADPLAAPAPVG